MRDPAPPVGAQAPRAPPSRRNVQYLIAHAEYVPTLTAAAALRVKAALSKAAWWRPFDLESGLPRPGLNLGPSVRDRQTSDKSIA